VKVLKCCTNINLNRQCLKEGTVPEYASIKVAYTSPTSKLTQKKMQKTSIKDEIKYLYKKKEIFNTTLYKTHLQAAREWGNSWDLIRET